MYIDFGSFRKSGDLNGAETAHFLLAGKEGGGRITFSKDKEGNGWIEWKGVRITIEQLLEYLESCDKKTT